VLVGPRTGASEWIVLATTVVRSNQSVSHTLVGTYHGCCSRAVTRGLDRRVLDGVNVWSLVGIGWESFAWVRCTGFTDGDLTMGSIPGVAHW
jgi:hypothetical protein